MDKFLVVESEINALGTVVSAMGVGYKEQKKQEITDILKIFERYLEMIAVDIRKSISLLDEFIVENKER